MDQSPQAETGPKPNTIWNTDFRVRRRLIVLYVKPVPQLVVVVFPRCAPKLIAFGIILSIVYHIFL